MSKIGLSGSIETFDWASGPPDAPECHDFSEILLDAGIRAGSNARSGEPDEAEAGEVNAHPANPGSHLDVSRRVPRRRVVFDSRGPRRSRTLTGPSQPSDGNRSEQVRSWATSSAPCPLKRGS